jgi:mannan endo-1,6-alpha-mannosidase
MYEPCEATGKCNVDQRSFKAYFSRWLAATAELAPFTYDSIMTELATSATAAVKTCTGGTSGTQCGLQWTTGTHDGSVGVGEQMAVLEVVQSNLIDQVGGWVSAVKGTGTSKGDSSAGISAGGQSPVTITPATAADKAGAGILTALVLIGLIGGSVTMILA